jgi:hypothetical protein
VSSQTSARTQLQGQCAALLRQELSIPISTSAVLTDCRTALAARAVSLAGVHAALDNVPTEVRATLNTLAPSETTLIDSCLARADAAAVTGNIDTSTLLAADARRHLDAALARAATRIDVAVRGITTRAAIESAAELGYTAQVCEGAVATGLDLRRGHEILLLAVHDGGLVEADHAGLADATCDDRQRALEKALARRGVQLIGTRRVAHRSERGGTLIAGAARRNDASLARAAAAEAAERAERAGQPGPARLFASAAADEGVRRRARITGGPS